jgi:hypothetical protein
MLIAAPFRTSRTQGAILIYPRRNAVFTREERALVGAIVGFGAVAIAHAELYATSHGQAHELHQLLEISSQLGSSKNLEHFLQGFVVRAAEFLRFGRCFIALFENNEFRVRYAVNDGEPSRCDVLFPEGIATEALHRGEVFWTDEASRTPGANLEVVAAYKVQQFLAVPLLGTGGKLLGMFGVLDRLTRRGITERFPEEAERRTRIGKFYHRPPGGESWCDVLLRVRSVIDTITRDHSGERVMVVAHQVVILLFRYLLEGLTEEQILAVDREAELANCSIGAYDYDPGVDHMVRRLWNHVTPIAESGAPVTAEPDVAAAPR